MLILSINKLCTNNLIHKKLYNKAYGHKQQT